MPPKMNINTPKNIIPAHAGGERPGHIAELAAQLGFKKTHIKYKLSTHSKYS